MNAAEGFIIGAGGLAFAGSFKEAQGFPPNGYSVVAATVALVFLASLTGGSVIGKPVKYAAGLMFLAAAIRYVPGLATNNQKGKK